MAVGRANRTSDVVKTTSSENSQLFYIMPTQCHVINMFNKYYVKVKSLLSSF